MLYKEKRIRKNIYIGEKLYYESLQIAQDLSLSYPEYIRLLLLHDVKRRKNPPDLKRIDQNKYYNGLELNVWSQKKRAELIRIMYMIQRMLGGS